MPKKKSGGVLLPWLSAHIDGKEGRFVQVGNSFFLSKAVQGLSPGAQRLYLAMALESGGKREFFFPRSTAKKHGFAETSFSRYVKELTEKKFIEVVFSGRFSHEKNLYRFSLDWKKKETLNKTGMGGNI